MRTCNLCKLTKPLTEFYERIKGSGKYRGRCIPCDRLTKGNDPEYKRMWKLANKYGITVDQYEAMLVAQDGVCAICKKEDTRGTRLCVDHDHETGENRRLLCKACNLVIGYAHEDTEVLRNAIIYLESFKEQGR